MRVSVIFLCVISLCFFSCEDVIDVDLPETETRLVVNGLLRVDFGEQFVPVEIRVTESSSFFEENQVTTLEDALIIYGVPDPNAPEIIVNQQVSNLAESAPGTGIYIPDPTFDEDQRIPTAAIAPGTVFILIIEHEGRLYDARTPFSPSVPIDNIEQGTETLFDEDDTEIVLTITDLPEVENYYVFEFGQGEFLALDDQFIDGQEFEFSFFPERDLFPGDVLPVSILGADQQFFNYVDLLVEQTENDGGVFETPAATVRGNIFDVTGLDNTLLFDNVNRPDAFPLGYFAVVQEFTETLTIE